MSKGESPAKTVIVATVLCVVCSIAVSTIAVSLKGQQKRNEIIDMKKNILMAAGMISPGDDVEEVFKKLETVVVDLSKGEAVDIDPSTVNITKDLKDPKKSIAIDPKVDIGRLKTRTKLVKVYTYKERGQVKKIIFPVISKGLWSTMWGFVALGSDFSTVEGFAYYSHGETPGLGGEVDNPDWKAQWLGKKIFNPEGDVAIRLVKQKTAAMADYEIDSLSGATITAVGVENSLKYWMGPAAYGPFLSNLKRGVM